MTVHFTVEVEAADEEAALNLAVKAPQLCLHCGPKLSFSADNIDYEKMEVFPCKAIPSSPLK